MRNAMSFHVDVCRIAIADFGSPDLQVRATHSSNISGRVCRVSVVESLLKGGGSKGVSNLRTPQDSLVFPTPSPDSPRCLRYTRPGSPSLEDRIVLGCVWLGLWEY